MNGTSMGGVAHELGMIVRGESRAHRLLRSRVTALVMLTLIVDAIEQAQAQ